MESAEAAEMERAAINNDKHRNASATLIDISDLRSGDEFNLRWLNRSGLSCDIYLFLCFFFLIIALQSKLRASVRGAMGKVYGFRTDHNDDQRTAVSTGSDTLLHYNNFNLINKVAILII